MTDVAFGIKQCLSIPGNNKNDFAQFEKICNDL